MLPLKDKKMLEVGCGTGPWFQQWKRWGISEEGLAGIDRDADRIKDAKESFPKADLRVGDVARLPWPEETFDFVLQSTLFTSILNPKHKSSVAREMIRVLKPGGVVFWYDFFLDNPWNPAVKGIGKKEIKSLFYPCETEFQKITLAPPLANRIAPASLKLCLFFESFKFLNTHYLALIYKKKMPIPNHDPLISLEGRKSHG
jgi:ubiquinone/menaquinone biosynthesis C-methylase UbiE